MPTRYSLHDAIGTGGMATVHLGRLLAPLGFSRVVAVKRLHAGLASQPDFTAMLVDEARIVARIRHPNVIPTLDVLVENGECLLVMEYVEGESLARLLRASSARGLTVPPGIAVAIVASILHGLHAAHSARSADGALLGIMHRDVSPQNVLVGSDGVSRIFDFGIAKAAGRLQHTRDGEFKGKLAYVAPEQLRGSPLSQRIDLYSASVVLWETLTSRRLFSGASEEEVLRKVLDAEVVAPSEVQAGVPRALDAVVMRGLSKAPDARFATAEHMAIELERAYPPASPREVGAWVRDLAHEALAARTVLVAAIENPGPPPLTETLRLDAPPAPPPPLASTTSAEDLDDPESLIPTSVLTSPRSKPRRRRLGWIALGAAATLIATCGMIWAATLEAPRVEPAVAAVTALPAAPPAAPVPSIVPRPAPESPPPASSAEPVAKPPLRARQAPVPRKLAVVTPAPPASSRVRFEIPSTRKLKK
ncbi:MAG: serine/threonine-protein kinase [Polyangiaceae bacterium]